MSLSKSLEVVKLQVLVPMLFSICAKTSTVQCCNQGHIKHDIVMQKIPKRLSTCCCRYGHICNTVQMDPDIKSIPWQNRLISKKCYNLTRPITKASLSTKQRVHSMVPGITLDLGLWQWCHLKGQSLGISIPTLLPLLLIALGTPSHLWLIHVGLTLHQ